MKRSGGMTRLHLRNSSAAAAHHGERQRLVVLALVFGEHRHAPRHAVEIHQRVEVPGIGGVRLKLRQVAAIAPPGGEGNRPAGEGARRQHGLGEGAALDRALIAVEVVAEHHRPALDRLGEQGVVVELRPQLGRLDWNCGTSFRSFLASLSSTGRPELSSGSANTTSKPIRSDAVLVEELLEQRGDLVAAPRPAPQGSRVEAFLVDVEDDDAPRRLPGAWSSAAACRR